MNVITFSASGSIQAVTQAMTSFRQIGHSLVAVLWSLLGGLLAGVFARREGAPSEGS